jgi:predicted nucleotidyltransferase
VTAPTDFAALLRRLLSAHVEFILIGGVAANVHGSARATYDIDVVYRRSADNLARIVAALAPLEPYLRGAPPGLPFTLDAGTLRRGVNFTLTTSSGEIDLLGEVTGGGTYDDLLAASEEVPLFGLNCRCATLEALIRMKRAAGRPKDFEALAELEALREERERQ